MCNFHPRLYVYLCEHFEDEPQRCERIQAFLGTAAFTEQLAYPITAKYHLRDIEGLPFSSLSARSRAEGALTAYHRSCIDQMHRLANELEKAWIQ